jgi:NTE family protein
MMSWNIKDRLRLFFKPGAKRESVGLALGGGGAIGLAHIPVLELLDSMGIRPSCISGTSMGAVIGALYASGMNGNEIRTLVDDTVFKRGDSPEDALQSLKKMFRFMDVNFMGPGVFKGNSIMHYLNESIEAETFEELTIPLKVVATDFWRSEQVVLSSGNLIDAVKASMGLPGIFSPVKIDDRILVDGAGVNPVPWDLLDDCDIVIAVDVLGDSTGNAENPPGAVKAVLEMFEIMQKSIVRSNMRTNPPDIYIRPVLEDIGLLDFHKAEDIFLRAQDTLTDLEEKLRHAGIA